MNAIRVVMITGVAVALIGQAPVARAQICLNDQQQVSTGSTSTSVAACDVNGDLDLDLISVNPGGNTVLVTINLSGGVFAASVGYPVGIDPEGVACARFDADEWPDIVVTNEDTFNMSVLINAGDGTFLPQVTYSAKV